MEEDQPTKLISVTFSVRQIINDEEAFLHFTVNRGWIAWGNNV
jgi:hypothetical protein